MDQVTPADQERAEAYLETLQEIAALQLPTIGQEDIDQANAYLEKLEEIADVKLPALAEAGD